MRSRGSRLVMMIAIVGLAACAGGTASTALPRGYPLNACPTIGEGAILPRDGFQLVAQGEIVFAYGQWHNESGGKDLDCGAQSVNDPKTTIHRSDLLGGTGVPFVATLHRAIPLVVPDPTDVRIQVFRDDSNGPTLVETAPLQLVEQYQAMGYILPAAPVGRYQMKIVSQAGEVLAEGAFEIVD